MRRGLVVVGSGLGLTAAWRRFRQRRRGGDPGAPGTRDPAEELRAKLAESRTAAATAPEREPLVELPGDAGEPSAEASPLDPEARRRSLHERARSSIDELKD